MQRQTFTVTGVAVSAPFPMDVDVVNFAATFATKVTGTSTYNVEVTTDDVFPDINNGDAAFNPATATWYPVTNMSAATANAIGNAVVPVTAVRLNCTAGTGTVVLTIVQATGRQ